MQSHPTEQLHLHLQTQRVAFRREPYPTAAVRRDRLERLRALVDEHGEALAKAISLDFGHRSLHETRLTELFVLSATIKHTEHNLKRWMGPTRVATALHFLPGSSLLLPQPLGVVGVISPWNYPVQLALSPVIAALAAGNRVMLKPSELTPRTSQLLARAVAQYFAPDEFTCITGDANVAKSFAGLPFDHLFFTGSTAIGRHVAQAAAANLTPVTLELGGKSPAILHKGVDLKLAAQRIAQGKLLNAGQTCVAPDYVFVPEEQVQPFVKLLGAAMKKLYPTIAANPDYSSIITPRHYARLQGLLAEAKAQGAKIVRPHQEGKQAEAADPSGRKLAPAIVLNLKPSMGLMREEIFGPVLPVLPYNSLDEVIAYVQNGERPLALYTFGADRAERQRLLRETHAGGVTVNDCIWHLAQEDLPFGGVGSSGQGAYHGEWGFKTFSKVKPVFTNPALSATGLFAPPYGKLFDVLLTVLKRVA
ncbi:MAG: coniferyl aldehyde dehydrogenase [Burkholderiales bacterium]|jgi:coniferyl-aldehyde dehydrogenase